jgi:hypothetical protein
MGWKGEVRDDKAMLKRGDGGRHATDIGGEGHFTQGIAYVFAV